MPRARCSSEHEPRPSRMMISMAGSYSSSRSFSAAPRSLPPGAAADLELHQLAAELDGVLLQVLADPVDLGVGDVRPLGADDVRGAGDQEEHVAVAEQLVGPHLVEHDPRVAPAGHLEGDPRRQVPLDQAGDDVDRRLLRRHDQVHADRPRLLRQADDVRLDLLGRRHHQVGHLVGDDHDVGHVGRDPRPLLARPRGGAGRRSPRRRAALYVWMLRTPARAR